MARTIPEIQNQMLLAIASDSVLSTLLTSRSATAVFRLMTYIIAAAIFVFEDNLDTHRAEVSAELYNQKAGSLPWYRTMALRFQYGFALVPDFDYYDNGDATDEQVEASKIIRYAAVTEAQESSRVILKIAGETGEVLSPILPEQMEAFESYIEEIKIAGVKVDIINFLPDRLFLNLTMYYDPELLASNGMSILNGDFPVNDAIRDYLKNLPFNGEFVIAHFVDRLQQVPGIKIPHVNLIQSSWIDPAVSDYGMPQPINIRTIPVSGYFTPMGFDNINYVADVV